MPPSQLGGYLQTMSGSGSYQILPKGVLDDLKTDVDDETKVYVQLHVPCGVVQITVPIVRLPSVGSLNRWKTDMTRPTSYLSVPSFATGRSVKIRMPPMNSTRLRWPELESREEVTVDIAYGGAWYVIVSLHELGFDPDCLSAPGMVMLPKLKEAVRCVRTMFLMPENAIFAKQSLRHPAIEGTQDLYGVIVTGFCPRLQRNDALGLCIFANSQVDRSPTGSGVQARIALAYAKREIKLDERRIYHSPVSNAISNDDAFIGEAVEEVNIGEGKRGVIVKVSGFARYTGCSTFVLDKDDPIGEGFVFDTLSAPR